MFLLPQYYWEVKKIRNKGRGVFACAEIEPGTVIGDYLGKVVRADQDYEKRQGGHYEMYYNDRVSILPDSRIAGIHFINHSCAPNCAMYTFQGHTLYFTLRRIFKGEELTVSYFYGIDKNDKMLCVDHECFCGAPICRGTVHTPAMIFEKWNAFDEKISKKYPPKKSVRYGSDLAPLPKYPKKIADNSCYELFGARKQSPYLCSANSLPSIGWMRRMMRKTGKCLLFRKPLRFMVYGVSNDLVMGWRV
ncbi:MAG: SET domain-containing protein [Parcubacteria group bacterium GW2011_GWA2_47_26]|nr:MAG: SET domain-containing protein [Parcubacteria group bacterium GW2011_GWA2_47_26]